MPGLCVGGSPAATILKGKSIDLCKEGLSSQLRMATHATMRVPSVVTAVAMNTSLSEEIAHTTARLVVEEGLEWGPAKRRALREMGLPARTSLPDNDQVEEAVREYIQIFCADTQPHELRALRQLALVWMERMAPFRPHLGGAVWRGTATRVSDVYLQLFCDDPKSAEIALIDHGVNYEPSTVPGLHGKPVDALSVGSLSRELEIVVGVHLLIYDLDDLRGALRADARGRSPRGNTAAVRQLLEADL